jgi:hypothetical protein
VRTKNTLEIIPVSLKDANAFVAEHHRHHKPVVGHKFSIGCISGKKLIGIAIVGRPVSRYLDNGFTLEVNRLCTDGTENACSKLYSAAARAAKELGYIKIITYILETENGASLRASGWNCTGEAGKPMWTSKRSNPLREKEQLSLFEPVIPYPQCMKKRYEKILKGD